MSSKPKAQDYQASDSEKASARVALQEKQYFNEKYAPLLRKMRDTAKNYDAAQTLRGRASADTAQALSGPSYQRTQSLGSAGDYASALQGQLAQANTAGKDIQNKMATNVLGTARGQAADAQTGMAQASRMATSDALERARNKQMVADAKYQAAGQVIGSFVGQGLDNMGTQAKDQDGNVVQGTFFSPVGSDAKRRTGFRERLGYSGFLGR